MPRPTRSTAKQEFAHRLKWLLGRAGGKRGDQSALARALRIKPVNITMYLKADAPQMPTTDTATKMAGYFGVPVEWLFLGQGQAPRGYSAAPNSPVAAPTQSQASDELVELQVIVGALVNSLATERPVEAARLAETLRAQRKAEPELQSMEFLNELLEVLGGRQSRGRAL